MAQLSEPYTRQRVDASRGLVSPRLTQGWLVMLRPDSACTRLPGKQPELLCSPGHPTKVDQYTGQPNACISKETFHLPKLHSSWDPAPASKCPQSPPLCQLQCQRRNETVQLYSPPKSQHVFAHSRASQQATHARKSASAPASMFALGLTPFRAIADRIPLASSRCEIVAST
jgi:hypothetical protein